MTLGQERAITLALNVLHVGFFECPRQDYQYFVSNDDWTLLMTAGGVNRVGAPPQEVALAVLSEAVARKGYFAEMIDFEPPTHYCSFLKDQIQHGERSLDLKPCQAGQKTCPYATFEHIKASAG